MSAPDLPVAIIGAGFSGTLLALNLLRRGVPVVLVERDHEHLARGLAFGTRRPEHLLNVRAANMSAFPDDPDHFGRWLGLDGFDAGNRFVPRLTYGRYLRHLLLEAMGNDAGRIWIKQQEAVDVRPDSERSVVLLDSGETITASAVVLALGNFPPVPQAPWSGLPPGYYQSNPWSPGATANLPEEGSALLLGTGLTAIDVALSLESAGFAGRITALSRRGLRNHVHAAAGPCIASAPCPSQQGTALVKAVRARAKEIGWREAIDELRPHTAELWQRHDTRAQARLLRHLRPWWDIHRHRLAPAVAETVDALVARDALSFVAGKVIGAELAEGRVRIGLRLRGQEEHGFRSFDRVIDCTGPTSDIDRVPNALLRNLKTSGRIRADAHRLGLDVDPGLRLVDTSGAANPGLYAIGPLTKGVDWEIVAVPDIRRQVAGLAGRLAAG